MRLSDYFYSINILIRVHEFEEDVLLKSHLDKGVFKLGTKLKCQNIQPTKMPLELNQEYTNPVVNAQNKETFKVSINSCVVAAESEEIGL